MRGKEYSREFCLGQHSKTKVELNPSRQLRQLRHAVVRFWRWEGLSKEVRSKGNNGAGMLQGSRWKLLKRKEKQRAPILNHVYYFLTSQTKSEMLRQLFKKYLLYHLKMICAWLCLCGYVHMSTGSLEVEVEAVVSCLMCVGDRNWMQVLCKIRICCWPRVNLVL